MWFCIAAAVGVPAIFLSSVISGPAPQPMEILITGAIGLAFAAAFLRATRMRVEFDPDGLMVFDYIATRHMGWDELADVTADYGGLNLIRHDGSFMTASSLGKPNWAAWTGTRTVADERVDMIKRELARFKSGGPDARRAG